MHSTLKSRIVILSFLVPLFIPSFSLKAQQITSDTAKKDSLKYKPYSAEVGIMPVVTSSKTVPFWMRANQYGSIPLDGLSGSIVASAKRIYADTAKKKLVDWGFGIDARLNAGNGSNVQLIESYVKGRLSIFQLKVGRFKNIIGITDPDLSVGAFSISGNALSIPQIQLSIPEYWSIPGTKNLFSIKGSFSYGWFGSTQLYAGPYVNAKYHQSSIYAKIGKPDWKVQFSGGINHQAMWGGENLLMSDYNLSRFKTFLYVVAGKVYNKSESKIGNQLGSIDQNVEVNLDRIRINAYHQFFYDVGALYYLANIKDGLFGLSFENKNPKSDIGWSKFLIEYFNSKSQAGELDAKYTPSGDENYYNNYIYYLGWSYKGENLGNPLLTNRKYAREDLVGRTYFVNTRVTALNIGALFNIYQWNIKSKITYSRNFGTYDSSPIGASLGGVHDPGPPPYWQTVSQFSGYLEASRPIKNNYYIGAALAIDNGGLLYNSAGGFIKLSKRW